MDYRDIKTAAVLLTAAWLVLKIISLIFISKLAFMRGFLWFLMLAAIIAIIMMFVTEPEGKRSAGAKKKERV